MVTLLIAKNKSQFFYTVNLCERVLVELLGQKNFGSCFAAKLLTVIGKIGWFSCNMVL